jgi:fidgetin-like protein 1
VDLLEALQESRKEASTAEDGSNDEKDAQKHSSKPLKLEKGKRPSNGNSNKPPGWIGDGTIPAVDYMDLSKPPSLPVLPVRPSPSVSPAVAVTPPPMSLERKHSYREAAPLPSPHKLSPSPVPAASTPGGTPLLTQTSSRGSSPERRKIMLTTLRQKDKQKPKYKTSSSRTRPAASKAAGLAWGTIRPKHAAPSTDGSSTSHPAYNNISSDSDRKDGEAKYGRSSEESTRKTGQQRLAPSSDYIPSSSWREPQFPDQYQPTSSPLDTAAAAAAASKKTFATEQVARKPVKPLPPPKYPAYRKEYLSNPVSVSAERNVPLNRSSSATQSPTILSSTAVGESSEPVKRTIPKSHSTPRNLSAAGANRASTSSVSGDEPARPRKPDGGAAAAAAAPSAGRKIRPPVPKRKPRITPPSSGQDSGEESSSGPEEDRNLRDIMKKLPKGIDVNAARQILNDVVVRGDEVHWEDVAGLEPAKKALKEAVVYPFLRPDLFMGLREPARGMLLFGPPGTGKTMLARAVATESKSTFFSVSASTLTSKWHGESEKLVRALFGLAKALAPSIIFVDEIDSLLSTRSSGSEHEASRRSKTEFLIQWSDLQRAAAGRDQEKKEGGSGDPSRVLVLAATNLPWDIDEAARRRFVRRQYIPLPEDHVRVQQLGRLLSHQKHEMSSEDIEVLVKVTEGEQAPPHPFPPP